MRKQKETKAERRTWDSVLQAWRLAVAQSPELRKECRRSAKLYREVQKIDQLLEASRNRVQRALRRFAPFGKTEFGEIKWQTSDEIEISYEWNWLYHFNFSSARELAERLASHVVEKLRKARLECPDGSYQCRHPRGTHRLKHEEAMP